MIISGQFKDPKKIRVELREGHPVFIEEDMMAQVG
jgi:hypothetical protein